MVVFVIVSMVIGLFAGGFVWLSGTSLLAAVLAYSVAGIAALMIVLLREFLCQQIKAGKFRALIRDDGQVSA